ASHVPKTYMVKVSGQPAEEQIQKLRRGIRISGRPVRDSGGRPGPPREGPAHTAPAQIRLVKEAENPWYEITLIEGKHRQIRRMFEESGHHVEKIKRIRYGALTLDVEPGQFRELTPAEVRSLRRPGSGQTKAHRSRGKSQRRKPPSR